MSTDTANPLWGPVENLRTLIASSATFQTLVGVEGYPDPTASAKAHIYVPAIETAAVVKAARPFALIGQGDIFEMTRTSATNFRPSGSLIFLLEDDVAAGDADDAEAAEKAFCKTVGDIFTDILTLSNDGAYLAVTGIRQLEGPLRADKKIRQNEGDFYQAVYSIEWGAW